MESKSRRFSSSLSSDSSFTPSSSLGSSRLYGRSGVLASDRYTRVSSIKLDTEHQSSRYQSPSRDYSVPESRHSSWKLSASSGSCDRSWADSPVGSRSKLFNSQGDSERRLGTYSGLLSAAQDGDSKRPKLSYTSRASLAGPSSPAGGSTSTSSRSSSVSDYSWKSPFVSVPKSTVSFSSTSEGRRSYRDVEDRSETALSGHRSSGLSSLYRPDRLSSYAQGARPKDSLNSTSRLSSSSSTSSSSSSLGLRPPTGYQPSLLSRDPCHSSARAPAPVPASTPAQEPPSSSSSSSSSVGPGSSRSCSWYVPVSSPAPAPAPPAPPTGRRASDSGGGGEPDGRRSTRQLLSRLASSVSSSLFSRRSSQDSASSSSGSGTGSRSGSSPASRSLDSSDDSSDPRREDGSSRSADSSRNGSPDGSDRRASASDGLGFLRRRRLGLSSVRETRGPEPARDATPDPRAIWVPTTLGRRRPPLFCRRRREGRDETAHMATTVSEAVQRGDRLPVRSRGAADDQDEDEDEEEEEEEGETEGAGASGPQGATASGGSTRGPYRVARRVGTLQNSVFRINVPPALESSLPENVMITVDIMAARRAAERQEKEKPAPSRDPEKLRKIQESLLLEESDEEEADLCRICQMREESPSNPLLEPCRCTGSLQYVHQDCMKKWLRSKIHSGSNLNAVTTCELCKGKLQLNIENFDINELYRTHERSEYEFISCGLYLVVLLHLCEQRFSDVLGAATDAGFLNLARTLHQMDDGERPNEDSRPVIDFCDSDDEDEEEY